MSIPVFAGWVFVLDDRDSANNSFPGVLTIRRIKISSYVCLKGRIRMATHETEDPSINRKVAFASVASAFGSVTSLFSATFLLNLPFFTNISSEDKGTLKTSLAAAITSLVTLIVGYYTRPGASDGIRKIEDD
uniref:Uncharacterized protein n=1 Tax=Oscillatoriales cyanobacterium SpSt-402 TaxID=2282168 RepID=A0A832M2L3_9CYAN